MIFIETTIFTKLLPKNLTDDEYREFQWYLLLNPEAGDLVRGSGGVRKVGGHRREKVKATISGHILKKIAEEIENE